MNFDLGQTLDFVQKRKSVRLTSHSKNRKKKRRLHCESASIINELSQDDDLPNIVSSLALDIGSKSKLTTNIESNCLPQEFVEQNVMDQDNLDNISE